MLRYEGRDHALRRVRVFKEAGKLSRRSRDEEDHPLRHPALKYRAKVTPPLRGEGVRRNRGD
jgi:hypothetical protein